MVSRRQRTAPTVGTLHGLCAYKEQQKQGINDKHTQCGNTKTAVRKICYAYKCYIANKNNSKKGNYMCP